MLNLRPAPPRTVSHIPPLRGPAARIIASGIDGLEPEGKSLSRESNVKKLVRVCCWLAAALTGGALLGTVAALILAAESVRY